MRALICLALLCAAPRAATAFCGFYVAGSDQPLVNDATQVVLVRLGTRTVLSMQNSYQGPPEAFAMVVPVPAVLREQDVKTLPREVFARVERMGAPRLVEYWEQDPCDVRSPGKPELVSEEGASGASRELRTAAGDLGVTIEAKFGVGEYQIVILSAKDSTGLDAWLRREKYTIPTAAEPLLRPYVEAGMKFFVAKVDPAKVSFAGGKAVLSPLRFHYDAGTFSLPIRLGLANSAGTQDLIVNILAPGQRYAVANYPNVTIPTNIDVTTEVKDAFGAFYAALFDRTLEKYKGAVVTEYAWDARTCDPCPGPQLGQADFQLLGADVLAGTREQPQRYERGDFVLTRLHARYGKDIQHDLVFEQAPPIAGGREVIATGRIEEGVVPAPINRFQARYAIRHAWTGPIRCEKPRRGVWGPPPPELATQAAGIRAALDLAIAPRDKVALEDVVRRDVPEIELAAGASVGEPGTRPGGLSASSTKKRTGCGCQATTHGDGLWVGLLAGASILLIRRRRR